MQDFKSWFANMVPSREAFDFLPGRIAGESTPLNRETGLQRIEADAIRWMKMIKSGLKPGEKANIRRAAQGNLKLCAYSMCEPPPPALVELIGVLMDVKPARNKPKNQEKFVKAAWLLAENPKASNSRIKREIQTDLRQVSSWRSDPKFKETVNRFRQHINNRKKFEVGG